MNLYDYEHVQAIQLPKVMDNARFNFSTCCHIKILSYHQLQNSRADHFISTSINTKPEHNDQQNDDVLISLKSIIQLIKKERNNKNMYIDTNTLLEALTLCNSMYNILLRFCPTLKKTIS